jgi:hypothetical protein
MVSALLNESSNASFIEIIPYFIILYLNIASTPIKHKRGRLTPHLLSLAQRWTPKNQCLDYINTTKIKDVIGTWAFMGMKNIPEISYKSINDIK